MNSKNKNDFDDNNSKWNNNKKSNNIPEELRKMIARVRKIEEQMPEWEFITQWVIKSENKEDIKETVQSSIHHIQNISLKESIKEAILKLHLDEEVIAEGIKVDELSTKNALILAEMLPEDITYPCIDAEWYGKIIFEWHITNEETDFGIFSIVIDKNRIIYSMNYKKDELSSHWSINFTKENIENAILPFVNKYLSI